MNVVVNGLMTNYHKVGSGKIIVCLHGWGDTAKSFSKLAESLQEKYTVLILDLPGFGATQAPPHAWGLQDYAEFVDSWLKKLGIKDVHAYVGHSYGGSLAILGLGNKNLKSEKLVLLASAGVRNKKSGRKKIMWMAAKISKVPLRLLPAQTRQKLRHRLYRNIGSDITLVPHMELTFKRIIGEDIQTAAEKISQQTLLIYGTEDKDTPVKDGKLLAKEIKSSRLEVIDAGHFLHQEQPGQVAKLIKDFLG